MSEFKFASRFESRNVPAYVPHQFASDLHQWFAITTHAQSGTGVDFVPFMEAYFNPQRSDAPSYQLAAAVYVMIVASQIILRDFERAEAARMCREKGWPVCSAGMGGFLHPIRMVYEADLLPRPGSADVPGYLEAMASVKDDLLAGLPRYIQRQTEEGMATMCRFLNSEDSSVDRPEWTRPSIMTTVETEEA